MNFFRRPFQFSAPDVAGRQSELKQRFGLSSEEKPTMFVDSPHISSVNSVTGSGSPRFQHRVPDYFEAPEEDKAMMDNAENVDATKQAPRVRVIPIQIESDLSQNVPNRKQTKCGNQLPSEESVLNSASSYTNNDTTDPVFNGEGEHTSPSKPRVRNIPIKVENIKKGSILKNFNIPVHKDPNTVKKHNGAGITKFMKKPSSQKLPQQTEQPKTSGLDVSIKQIEDALKEFRKWKEAVENFNGVQGDKKYRYLDEMLMRCMLKLDDVETFGTDTVRKCRKAAVKEIQDCINVLEAKGQTSNKIVETQTNTIEPEEKMDIEPKQQPIPPSCGVQQQSVNQKEISVKDSEPISAEVNMTQKETVPVGQIAEKEPKDIDIKVAGPTIDECPVEFVDKKTNEACLDSNSTLEVDSTLSQAVELSESSLDSGKIVTDSVADQHSLKEPKLNEQEVMSQTSTEIDCKKTVLYTEEPCTMDVDSSQEETTTPVISQ